MPKIWESKNIGEDEFARYGHSSDKNSEGVENKKWSSCNIPFFFSKQKVQIHFVKHVKRRLILSHLLLPSVSVTY